MEAHIEAGTHTAILLMLSFLSIAVSLAMMENGPRVTRVAGCGLFIAAFSLLLTILTGGPR
jgi:hypothetical protein